jgi:pentatricopeptide repeat protein
MDEMIEKDIAPNEFTHSVAITACGNGGQWSKALELLDKVSLFLMHIVADQLNTIQPQSLSYFIQDEINEYENQHNYLQLCFISTCQGSSCRIKATAKI